MAHESRRISCGLKVHFRSHLNVCLFVQYARGRFPVIRLAHVARLAHTHKSLGPHSGEMRLPGDCTTTRPALTPQGFYNTAQGRHVRVAHPGKTPPPRCRIYPERVRHRTIVEPFQGTSHKNEPTQGAPGVPATLGYIVKPLRGRNPR
jgi:hypothetical protein